MRDRLRFILAGLFSLFSLPFLRGGNTAFAADTEMLRRLNREGENLLEKSRYNEALNIFRKMQEAAKDNAYATAVATFYLGRCELELAEYDKALKYLEEADRVFTRLNKENEQAIVVQTKARLYAERSRFKESLKLYETAAEVFERIKNKDALFDLFNSSGAVHAYLGLSDQAQECMSLAQRLLRPKPHPRQLALLNNNTGITSVLRQDYAIAQKSFEDALQQFRKYGDQKGEATALNNIGHVHESRCEYAKAISAHQEALKITERISDPRDQAVALNNLGNVYLKTGAYDAASEAYQDSLKISEQRGIKQFFAETMNNLGLVKLAYGQTLAAKDSFLKSLEVSRDVGSQSGEAWALHNLAYVLKEQGEFKNSLNCSNEAIRLGETLGNRRLKATAMLRLGNLCEYRGLFDEALRDYNACGRTQKDISDRYFYSNMLVDSANILTRKADFAQAEKNYREAISIRRSIGSPSGEALCSLALFFVEKSNYVGKRAEAPPENSDLDHAAKYLDEAAAVTKKDIVQDSLLLGYVRGKSLVEKDPGRSVEQFAAVRSQAEASGWGKYLFLGSVGLGLAYERLKNLSLAQQSYRVAANYVEGLMAKIAESERTALMDGEQILGIKNKLPFDRLAKISQAVQG